MAFEFPNPACACTLGAFPAAGPSAAQAFPPLGEPSRLASLRVALECRAARLHVLLHDIGLEPLPQPCRAPPA